jgi:hypothetical protein
MGRSVALAQMNALQFWRLCDAKTLEITGRVPNMLPMRSRAGPPGVALRDNIGGFYGSI